jgi:energy-coupling factor transporter ATP-binding protein EcfA2
MPESVGFWRSRIEAGNDRDTFRVGLLFGPSGCGKTSLVRAGLLPRLSGRVVSVYAGATADGIEACLLGELRERCPDLPDGLGLAATLVAIRKGAGLPAGSKILIVLDQFERWLHGRGKSKETELVAALRQCDGEHVQAIVVVRDDSWSSASRFLRDLEDRIVEGGNSAAVDPFDLRHARRVLEAFGRGCGALPEGLAELPVDQESFLVRAVSGLAKGDRIVPIRLTLFAMAVKDKAWSPGTLEIIPPRDAGITLLEEILGAGWRTPDHRLYRKAVRSLLAAVLPEPDADPCDRKKCRHELLVASGYASRPSRFEALMRFLVDEVGLITPMDSGRKCHRTGDLSPEERGPCYGLTHDYVVPMIREWLASKRKRPGRSRDDSSTAVDSG